MPERRLDPRSSQWGIQALTRWWCTWAIVQGFFIILGGAERWSGRSYQLALTVPGAPATWGVVLMILGAWGLLRTFCRTGHWRGSGFLSVFLAMMMLAAWMFFFAISMFWQALTDPRAATTGVITYVAMAVASAVLGSIYRISR